MFYQMIRPFWTFNFLISLSVVISSCNQKLQGQIKVIEVRDNSPQLGETFYRVYYLGDLIMYQSQYRLNSFQNQFKVDSLDKFSNDYTIISSEWKNKFFVFQKDSTYGYNYDPDRGGNNNLRLSVDSVLKFIKGTNRFDSFLSLKPDTSTWNEDKSELREVYKFPEEKKMPDGRLILLYSKKLNHLKESFNSKVDHIKGMKLYRTETIFEEYYDAESQKLWPPVMNTSEMKEMVVENPKEIFRYFKKYKKQQDIIKNKLLYQSKTTFQQLHLQLLFCFHGIAINMHRS